jgi:hypothetical protein
MTNVGRSVSRSICDVDGHRLGTAPVVPGVLSYASKVRKPKATAPAQAMPNRAVTNRVFVRRGCKENDLRRAPICSREYSTSRQKWVSRRKMARFSSLQRLEFTNGRKKESLASELLKVISGGQTGVDRGALDAALALEVECGGWCPAARLAEDGTIPKRYPVTELANAGYAERTARNVADSDGTLVISKGEPIGGTRETVDRCIEMAKPYLIIDCASMSFEETIEAATEFVKGLSFRVPQTAPVQLGPRNLSSVRKRTGQLRGPSHSLGLTILLNVAGPRASQWPEGHQTALQILSGVLRLLSGQNDASEYSS